MRFRTSALLLLLAAPAAADPSFNVGVNSRKITAAAGGAPTIRAVGAVTANTAAVTVPVPTGTASGDLVIIFCETEDQVIDTNDAAWTESASSPNSAAGGNRITVFWLISDGSDDMLMTDSGTQNVCYAIAITTGTFNAGTPFNVTGQDDDGSGTAVSIAGVTTTVNNVLILAATARHDPDAVTTTEFSGEANANLTGVTERVDDTRATSGGSSMLLVSGVMATAGATGATTSTAATTAIGTNITLGIAPP